MARHMVVMKNIKNLFIKLNHPKSVSFVRVNGKAIAENTNISILSFVVFYLFLFLIGTIIVTFTGLDPVTASSSVATCMAGIGPGLGGVGPTGSFADIPQITKVILSLVMIIGRLEIITVLRFSHAHSGNSRGLQVRGTSASFRSEQMAHILKALRRSDIDPVTLIMQQSIDIMILCQMKI